MTGTGSWNAVSTPQPPTEDSAVACLSERAEGEAAVRWRGAAPAGPGGAVRSGVRLHGADPARAWRTVRVSG